MNWEKIDINSNTVKSLQGRYGVSSLLASLLVRRNITDPDDIKFFLENDSRYLHNPFLFKDMEDVVDRVHVAIDEGEKILIFGDKDVDGVTSTVILYEALETLGLDVIWRVTVGDNGYGLSTETVEEAYKNNISLIFTVDCGITNFESINMAKDMGMDVIILDHHNQRPGELPKALSIINPKLDDSTYPFSGLAACGVVSKVLWALSFSFLDTLYKSNICFLDITESNGVVEITASKLYNLLSISRVSVNLDCSLEDKERLVNFLQGEQILIYNEGSLSNILKDFFGSGYNINLLNIMPEIQRVLPGVGGRPLGDLLEKSKMKLYSPNGFTQMDLIENLFITYVERRYSEKFTMFTDSLDLVALGTVADMMPVKDENRILIKKGLKLLRSSKREGLQALLLKQNLLGKNITSKDISWVIAPVINSAGRMKKANMAVELLICKDRDMKHKLTLDVLAVNKERRELSDSLWLSCFTQLNESFEEFNNKIVFAYHDDMIKGITGIIAAKALSVFSVPGIVLARDGEFVVGSIRSRGELNIGTLMVNCGSMILEWGGHKSAAGFRLKYSDMPKLKALLKKEIKKEGIIDKVNRNNKSVKVDASIPNSYLNPGIIDIYDTFEPFGDGNPQLTLTTKGVKIIDINFMGKGEKKHLKMLLEIGEQRWPGIFWNAAELVGTEFTKDDVVNIAYRVERNFYGGNETLQLIILDIIT
ncbi:MAG: single-stranded-DNA-specific exonuclease RecJ [Spirochaetaceae bacterium 4572_7]|nr:MAG: single-stranded-DNA-specific exonuclease RecJ [Spirochaetaceae bacterium 4572_7]